MNHHLPPSQAWRLQHQLLSLLQQHQLRSLLQQLRLRSPRQHQLPRHKEQLQPQTEQMSRRGPEHQEQYAECSWMSSTAQKKQLPTIASAWTW